MTANRRPSKNQKGETIYPMFSENFDAHSAAAQTSAKPTRHGRNAV
ncbi:MAG: hypothetical protein ACLR4Z_05375 [Butyricicoccaceae bacterium]